MSLTPKRYSIVYDKPGWDPEMELEYDVSALSSGVRDVVFEDVVFDNNSFVTPY